jgi:putative membrane protein
MSSGACQPLLLAHAGAHALELAPYLDRWTKDPLVIALLVVSSALYLAGLARLWGRGAARALRWYELLAFALGQASVVLALLSPLDALSDLLFSAHMGQHELLMLVAAPLLVLGRPLVVFLWALPAGPRQAVGRWTQGARVRRSWKALTHPLGIVVAHAAAIWVWHLPVLFEAALYSEPIHVVQHACFFVTASLFWWSMIYGRYGRIGYGVAVGYVFLTAAHTGGLGALATFARSVWYPTYSVRATDAAVSALEDQQLAGLIMWIPAGAVLMVLGLALFAAWIGEASRRVALGHADALSARTGNAPPPGRG